MDKGVEGYLEKQKSPQREICKKLRKIILETSPGAKEETRWGALVFAGGKFYIGALKDHVNMGFAIKGLSREEQGFFEGNGKIMRHLKFASLEEIDEKKLAGLIRLVCKKAVCEGC